MKTKILMFVVSFFLCMSAMGQYTIEKPYDYPIKPGMSEWAEFQTGQEMLDACQIPVEVLSKLTTEALVETCVNYPLAINYSASNNERDAISFMIESFNGLKELSNRKDGASALVKKYKDMTFSKNFVTKNNNGGASSFLFGYLELLLADDLFVNNLSKMEYDELKTVSLEKYELKLNNPDDFGLLSVRRPLLLNSVAVLKSDSSLNKSDSSYLQAFVDDFQGVYPEELERVSKIIIKK